MTYRLDSKKPGFAKLFTAFLNLREQKEQNVAPTVEAIIGRVRKDGDTALHRAAAGGHTDVAQALILAGAALDIQNKVF